MQHSLDFAGYIASALVLLTFCMKDMVALRIAAMCSNVAFLVYGAGLNLVPVLVLHGILLPLNAWRLASLVDWSRKIAMRAGVEVRLESDPSRGPPK